MYNIYSNHFEFLGIYWRNKKSKESKRRWVNTFFHNLFISGTTDPIIEIEAFT